MNFNLKPEEKQALLKLARQTIQSAFENKNITPENLFEAFNCGAFVSLHTKNGALRGCVGIMHSGMPLAITVQKMALAAAFEDTRFLPLNAEEFKNCILEISVLSPMERCEDTSLVETGVHGLYLKYNGKSGVLLPQVPVEQRWNREEYLEHICLKAGLPPDVYNLPGAELWTFTALVFSE
jgi:AmmeMemoRadiSam system protein A